MESNALWILKIGRLDLEILRGFVNRPPVTNRVANALRRPIARIKSAFKTGYAIYLWHAVKSITNLVGNKFSRPLSTLDFLTRPTVSFKNRARTSVFKETVHLPNMWFHRDSSFVVWHVRNPNPKISRFYELYRRRYLTSKFLSMGLLNFCYPI